MLSWKYGAYAMGVSGNLPVERLTINTIELTHKDGR
jgi:hypothetical protein